MAGELLRPGVEVIQSLATPAPSFTRPTLVPCVVGPAFEVLNVLNTDGTLNSKAKYGTYLQYAKAITESSFPDPRGNIDELDIQEATVKPYMLNSGNLTNIAMEPGSSFLAVQHGAGKASLKSGTWTTGSATLDLTNKPLVLCINNPVRTDTSKDVTVTFTGAITVQQAADQINAAFGYTVATVTADFKVLISSPTYGALSSVTVRKGTGAGAIALMNLGAAAEERVEGCGWRGQDDTNNDTVTPWIEFYTGAYLSDGTNTAFPAYAFITDIETGVASNNAHAALNFLSGIPLQVGDYFFADGVRVKGGEIAKVETSRFKIGTISTALSTTDSAGNYTSKVYDIQQVGTPFDSGSPFAPSYGYFVANSLYWKKQAPIAATVTGSVAATAAVAGAVTGSADLHTGTFALAGLTLHYVSTIAGVDHEDTFTFTGGPFSLAQIVTALTGVIPGVTPSVATVNFLKLTCTGVSATSYITIKADSTAKTILGLANGSADLVSVNQSDAAFTSLTGTYLKVQFDKNPHIYTVPFQTNSIDDAVAAINTYVGTTVASKSVDGIHVVLTSALKGKASYINVILPGPTSAETVLGLTAGNATATGSARPLPDAYMDDASVLHIGGQLLRDSVTGYPLDQEFNSGILYIQYKALRKDVSASAKTAGVLRISDQATLSSVLEPLTSDNPLGLGMFLCMINAPTFEVKCLGIDEVTAAAPYGTGAAWARAASMLEAEEVYAIAPLTQDEVVHGLWMTHCTVMSSPEQGGERIVFFNKVMPTRANPTIALSGTQANSTATNNQMLLDGNPSAGLVDAGINPAQPIPESAMVYMEFEADGVLARYSVSGVSGPLVSFRTTFANVATNIDGFFSTVTLSSSVVNAAYALNVRGASLAIPGTNPVQMDYSLIASTVGDANATFKNRRAYSVFPDTIKTVIQGTEQELPGFYAAPCIAGMVASQPPQQGFTNFPITGLTGVVGTEKFTKKQLNVIAGGGTYILIQDVQGGAVSCRHQLSTNLTSIETRELSITKVIDFCAKFLRQAVRQFIGVNNVNSQFLDTLGTTIHAVLQFLQGVGVINGSNLNNIAQDSTAPDTVLIDVTLDVPFPCNYIRLTLVV